MISIKPTFLSHHAPGGHEEEEAAGRRIRAGLSGAVPQVLMMLSVSVRAEEDDEIMLSDTMRLISTIVISCIITVIVFQDLRTKAIDIVRGVLHNRIILCSLGIPKLVLFIVCSTVVYGILPFLIADIPSIHHRDRFIPTDT